MAEFLAKTAFDPIINSLESLKSDVETNEANSETWAEGTDAAVVLLGGEKSSKGWALDSETFSKSSIRLNGVVADEASLPASPTSGDAYLVKDQPIAAKLQVWSGTAWEKFSYGAPLTVEDYGAKAQVGFDSTSAFQDMADALGYVNVPYTAIPFEIDAFVTTKTTVITSSNGKGNILLRTPTTANDPGFTLAHADSKIEKVHIDANSTSRSCVSVTANNCEAFFTSKNVTADAGSTTFTSGLEVNTGANNCRFDVYAENFSNTGQSNGSVPRVVTVQGTADNYSGRVQGLTVQSGLTIGSSTGRGKISELIIEGASDNGLYDLGGTVDIGEVVYDGSEEGIVISGDTTIGTYTIHGGAVTGIGLNGGTNLRIGTYQIIQDGTESLGNAMRTRTSSGFGTVQIDSISGRMRGSVLFNIGNALAVENLNIGSVDVDYEYDAGVTGTTTQWANFEDVERFSIRNFKARIIDINDVLTTEEFRFRLPTVTKKSEIHFPQIEILDSDESTVSSADLTLSGFTQETVSYIGTSGKGITETRSITIADDSVGSISGLSTRCMVFAYLVKASVDTGFLSFQLATATPAANLISQSSTVYATGTGTPTGTTGTDGKITFYADTAEAGKLTIENRQGSSRTLQLFIIQE